MRAVIVVDRAFGRAEAAMLSRLEIGLADEGYRVVHALPVAAMSTEPSGVYSTSVGYVDTGLGFTLRSRVSTLVETLKALAEKQGDRGPVNVVHALGGKSWPVGVELARQTGGALVLELERASLAAQVPAMLPEEAGEEARPTPLISVPDDRLHAEVLRRAPKAGVHVAKWGVHVPSGRHGPTGAPAVVVLIERGDSRAAVAVLEALASIAKDAPDLLVFVDVEDGKTAGVWKVARRLGLLDRLSMVPELEGRRDPALQMDALLLPDAAGVQHSLVLDAMAAGLAVVAAPDPLVEYLIDGKTARLVASPTKSEWERAIRETVLDVNRASELGVSAREYIRATRPVSGHIHAVLEVYARAQREHELEQTRRRAVA